MPHVVYLPLALREPRDLLNTALQREYGKRVSAQRYLKLLAAARKEHHRPHKNHLTKVCLRLDGMHIWFVFDPTGPGALIGVLPGARAAPVERQRRRVRPKTQ